MFADDAGREGMDGADGRRIQLVERPPRRSVGLASSAARGPVPGAHPPAFSREGDGCHALEFDAGVTDRQMRSTSSCVLPLQHPLQRRCSLELLDQRSVGLVCEFQEFQDFRVHFSAFKELGIGLHFGGVLKLQPLLAELRGPSWW